MNTEKASTEAPDAKPGTSPKTKRAAGKAPASRKKRTLKEKAVQAVAAVAKGVGGAIAVKRKRSTARKSQQDAESGTINNPIPPTPANFTSDDVALRAYFISERRRAAGMNSDPLADWLEAERELIRETNTQA